MNRRRATRKHRWGVIAALAVSVTLPIAGITAGSVPAVADTGDYIIVQQNIGGGFARINSDGTGFQTLKNGPNVYSGGWSSDGNYFAYRYYDGAGWNVGIYDANAASDLGVIAPGNFDGWTQDDQVVAAGYATSVATRQRVAYSFGGPPYSQGFVFSPDGTKLAYRSNDGNGNIFTAVRNVATGAVTEVSPLSAGQLAWDGSSTKLVFDGSDNVTGEGSIQLADLRAQTTTDVTADLGLVTSAPSLSPDGTLLAYESGDDSGPRSHVRRLPGGAPILLAAPDTDYLLVPMWRPHPSGQSLPACGTKPPSGAAPVVKAPVDQTAQVGQPVSLSGSGDAGLTFAWSELRGTGAVVFGNPSSASTTATLPVPGVYTLQLVGGVPGVSASCATTTLTVPEQPLVVTGSGGAVIGLSGSDAEGRWTFSAPGSTGATVAWSVAPDPAPDPADPIGPDSSWTPPAIPSGATASLALPAGTFVIKATYSRPLTTGSGAPSGWSQSRRLRVQPGPKTVAMMGDSYASGENAPPFIFGTQLPLACHRSYSSWTYQTGLVLTRAQQARMLFTACSSATSTGFWSTGNLGEPTQTAQLQSWAQHADVVLLNLGGNDAGFADVVTHCILASNCASTTDKSETSWRSNALAKASAIRTNLITAFGSLRAVTGDRTQTKVYVMGYPNPFDSRTCAGTGTGLLSPAEQAWIGQTWLAAVNAAVRSAALDERIAGSFVDVQSAFTGHGICSPAPYASGIVVDVNDPMRSFHPTATGYSALSAITLTRLRSDGLLPRS